MAATLPELDRDLIAKRDRMIAMVRAYGPTAVAFSGGVDSAVVAKAAQLALGADAVAVTAVSPSLASGELSEAEQLARLIGIRHHTIYTSEFQDPNYLHNAPDRCYFCKTELYVQLERILPELGARVIANGANTDDTGDWRPGMNAATEHCVRSPLIEAGLSKIDVRRLARSWELPAWDKPATPCLSSRIAYGVAVTPDRVAQIDAAERFLHELGFRELRVRYPEPNVARIEVPLAELPRLVEPATRGAVVDKLRALGFKSISLDLEGFRSGSLNTLLPVETLANCKPHNKPSRETADSAE